jgi:hypothetical protein
MPTKPKKSQSETPKEVQQRDCFYSPRYSVDIILPFIPSRVKHAWEALTTDSLLLTPHGWIKMKDVKIGDLIIGKDGLPHSVLEIYPQGVKKTFKVSFSDNTVVECTEDHLWEVKTSIRNNAVVLPLSIIKQRYSNKKPKNYYKIPTISQPVIFNDLDDSLPINPYLLGVILGDGCVSDGSVRVIMPDKEIYENVIAILPDDVYLANNGKYKYTIASILGRGNNRIREKNGTFSKLTNSIKTAILNLGLNGKTAIDKHIPEIYKLASPENRLSILQGLIDTDGHVTKNGNLRYYTISKKLCEDVCFIVGSLGGITKVYFRDCSYNYKVKRNRTPIYEIGIFLPKEITSPCKLTRKLIRYNSNKKRVLKNIVKIEYSGLKDCQCIVIDSKDGLFVTNNFVLTHNCSAGSGKISNYLTEKGYDVLSTDINANYEYCNFLESDRVLDESWMIITNCPFSLKKSFYEKCMQYSKKYGVAWGLLVPADYSTWLIDAIWKNNCERIIPNSRINYITPNSVKIVNEGETKKYIEKQSGRKFKRFSDINAIVLAEYTTCNENFSKDVMLYEAIEDIPNNLLAKYSSSQFHSCWLTYGLNLGKSETFVELTKEMKENI